MENTNIIESLKTRLKAGEVRFSFRKVNGEVREARGTLNNDCSEDLASYVAKGNYTNPENVIKYWDLDKNSWRCLQQDSLIAILD